MAEDGEALAMTEENEAVDPEEGDEGNECEGVDDGVDDGDGDDLRREMGD